MRRLSVRSRVLLTPFVLSPAAAATTSSPSLFSYLASLLHQPRRAHSSKHDWSHVPATPDGAKQFDRDAAAHDRDRRSALVKCIEKEIDDEALRIDKDAPPLPESWDVQHDEGTSFFTMTRRAWKRKGGGGGKEEEADDEECHTIRCQLTERDPSLDPECDLRGEHFPFTFLVESKANGKVTDFSMDVIEGECVVDNIRTYDNRSVAYDQSIDGHFERQLMFPGPNLDEAEEEVLDSVQAFLAERDVDDQMAEFIAHYSAWIEQVEYERWLKELRSFVTA